MLEQFLLMDQDRLKKLKQLRSLGINPYPDRFKRTHTLSQAKKEPQKTPVYVAGRLMTLREMGKLVFAHLQDFSGRMQIVFELEHLGKEVFKLIRFFDLGDFLGIEGEIFVTKKGEISVMVKKFVILSKSLQQLPEKWHGLKDKEIAYRQRYLDLVSHRETVERFISRSQFIKKLREFYWKEGFIEIETPVLSSTASGALAKPFTTHHNALNHDFYLRIALETYLKEATVGGFEKVFEIGKVFRNEGIDPSHLQEFTIVEHYVVYWNYEDNMKFTEKMFHFLLHECLGTMTVKIPDREGALHEIDFSKPWKRITLRNQILEDSGIDIHKYSSPEELRKAIKKKKIILEGVEKLGLGNLIDHLYKKVSRPKLIQPTFLLEHPIDVSPLARKNEKNPRIVDRFQFVVSGWEIVNAYSEIVDPLDQAERFEQQAAVKEKGDEEAHSKDDDFVIAMEYGMPPQSGWGMGIDRIIALLTQQENLKDVVLFPLMRPLHDKKIPLFVIGKIENVKAHEKKEGVKICTVNIGPYGEKTVISNCKNIREGLKVVVALPGAEMLDWHGTGKVAYIVEPRKVYGVLSEAVLCSPEEVGIHVDESKREFLIEIVKDMPIGSIFQKPV